MANGGFIGRPAHFAPRCPWEAQNAHKVAAGVHLGFSHNGRRKSTAA
ncbi:hypothetical protein SAMN02746041_02804 [Desulfacinum hydrothermale DSM 13146]|uniref:Uncharacterized protein n=1 Tax=Desulfacinum hydrothermale DSM 13146 TaxID=1121390 RepID=A0A1W1XTP7_9BACT|nr:hypothetical protein SAMN02746041_02804 [Desulfacinum hydrothermale DSM 13146]